MLKMMKLLYKFLKKKIYLFFDFIRNKRRDFSIIIHSNKVNNDNNNDKSHNLIDIVANTLVGKELDKYLRSLKPLMPLLNHDPAIKTMKIGWNTSLVPMDEEIEMREKLEEQIINKYVRYVSRHIFVLLQPNKHKILLNVTAYEQLGNYQIPIGEQVLYKDPQQLESYLMHHLMGVLVSYEANGIEDFTYFISNIDNRQYEELSIKIKALFKD